MFDANSEASGSSNSNANEGLNHRIVWLKKNETGLGLKIYKEVKDLYRGKAQRQAIEFYSLFQIPAAIGRKRSVAIKTEKSYRAITSCVLDQLKEMNMPVQNLDEISTKQVRKLFRNYEERGLSASRMASINTVLRRLGVWLGKPELCPPLDTMLENPNAGTRTYTAEIPKAWEAIGVNPIEVIAAIKEECEVTGVQFDLAMQFGVRVEEFMMCNPAKSIREKEQCLYVIDGAKGGRPRPVPIETTEQRAALDRALEIASRHPEGLMMAKPWQTLDQAKEHVRYILKKLGINKKKMGVTPHGLRHRYACVIYKQLTGEDAPVMGGGYVDPELDKRAREEISMRLGHSRIYVTSAYLGHNRTLGKNKRKALKTLETLLQADAYLIEAANSGGIQEFHVVGSAADGNPVAKSQVMGLGYMAKKRDGESQADADDRAAGTANRMARRVGQLLGVTAAIMPMSSVEAIMPTYEIYLTGKASGASPDELVEA